MSFHALARSLTSIGVSRHVVQISAMAERMFDPADECGL